MGTPERPRVGGNKPQVPGTQLGLGLEPPLPTDGISVISKPEDKKVVGDTPIPVISTEGGDSLGDQHRAIEAYRRQRGFVEMAVRPERKSVVHKPRGRGR